MKSRSLKIETENVEWETKLKGWGVGKEGLVGKSESKFRQAGGGVVVVVVG